VAESLITLGQYEKRLGLGEGSLSGAEASQVEAYIEDASALVRDIAADDFLDDAGALDVPASIVPVVVSMVRRAVDNPRGLTGEQIGPFSYQAAGSNAAGIFATRNEKRIIRRAVGKLGAGTAQLEGDLPLPTSTYGGGAFEDELLDSL